MGALINFGAIIVAGIIGTLLKKKIKQDLTDTLLVVMAICLIFVSVIGIVPTMIKVDTNTGSLKSSGTLCLIISMFLGTIIGYFLKINDHIEHFGTWLETRFKLHGFGAGFVPSTLFFCIGAMAIVGSIQEGVYGKFDILIAKSVIDFVTALALSASLGYGVIFASIPILVYEGILTLCAHQLEGAINGALGAQMLNGICMVGYAIILAIAINMLGFKKIKSGDLVPAMFIPMLYYWILSLLNIADF